MRKILLVDDELLVRTNIRLLLSSHSETLEICGEASNGREALELISSVRPDIILSDMQMPEMNGLELCKAVRFQFPEIAFVALSNYDDFELVRGVLKNGGIDYLLKHQLSSDTLSDTLLNIKLQKHEKTDNGEISSTATINSLKKTFMTNWLSGVYIDKDMIDYNIRTLHLSLHTTRLCPIILMVDNYNQRFVSQSLRQQNTLEFSIINIGTEILDSHKNGIIIHIKNGNYCILLSFDKTPSMARINEFIHQLILQISSKLKLFLNISTSYSIGEICPDCMDVPHSFEKAMQASSQKFYTGNQSIFHSQDISIQEQPLAGLDRQLENQLWIAASQGDFDSIQIKLKEFFRHIRQSRIDFNNAQMAFTDIIGILLRVAKEKGISLNTIFRDSIKPSNVLAQLNTLDQLQEWFLTNFQALCEETAKQISVDSVYVQKALAIIHQKYHTPITLQTLANEIGISFGYLSTIFKAETGQNFSEYLNSYRITMAKNLLNCGNTDLHKISAACGFQDYSYFFKVFKKMTSMTPSAYMKQHSKRTPAP